MNSEHPTDHYTVHPNPPRCCFHCDRMLDEHNEPIEGKCHRWERDTRTTGPVFLYVDGTCCGANPVGEGVSDGHKNKKLAVVKDSL